MVFSGSACHNSSSSSIVVVGVNLFLANIIIIIMSQWEKDLTTASATKSVLQNHEQLINL
jgi:hypothetical protein